MKMKMIYQNYSNYNRFVYNKKKDIVKVMYTLTNINQFFKLHCFKTAIIDEKGEEYLKQNHFIYKILIKCKKFSFNFR